MKYIINYMHPMSGEIEQVVFIADEGSPVRNEQLAEEMAQTLAQGNQWEIEYDHN